MYHNFSDNIQLEHCKRKAGVYTATDVDSYIRTKKKRRYLSTIKVTYCYVLRIWFINSIYLNVNIIFFFKFFAEKLKTESFPQENKCKESFSRENKVNETLPSNDNKRNETFSKEKITCNII